MVVEKDNREQLLLRIDGGLIIKAKKVCLDRKVTVSKLVEDFFKKLK